MTTIGRTAIVAVALLSLLAVAGCSDERDHVEPRGPGGPPTPFVVVRGEAAWVILRDEVPGLVADYKRCGTDEDLTVLRVNTDADPRLTCIGMNMWGLRIRDDYFTLRCCSILSGGKLTRRFSDRHERLPTTFCGRLFPSALVVMEKGRHRVLWTACAFPQDGRTALAEEIFPRRTTLLSVDLSALKAERIVRSQWVGAGPELRPGLQLTLDDEAEHGSTPIIIHFPGGEMGSTEALPEQWRARRTEPVGRSVPEGR